MKTMTLEVKRSSQVRSKSTHCEVVAFLQKKKSDAVRLHSSANRYRKQIEELNKAGELPLGAGGTCMVRYKGVNAKHVLFVNIGVNATGIDALNDAERFRRLGAAVSKTLAAEKCESALVHFESLLVDELKMELNAVAQAFAEGMWLATYRFRKYFTKKDDSKHCPQAVTIAASAQPLVDEIEEGVEAADATTDGTFIARDFGNEPSNRLTPEVFANEMVTLSKKYKLECTVFDPKKLKEEKMGLLLGVGQGSAHSPRMVVMEYNPKGAQKTLALVGKGMTFDAGGISIKPSARMEDMKHDMCGAASVIGATLAIARLKLPIRVLCVVAAADNMPDGNAIQPGNILVSRAGKTVEINNTDAEGRLILADAIDWTQDQKPDFIIDAATLTGASSVALGKVCAGLMGNDDDFNFTICQAAEHSGERVWELPLYREYFDDLKSEYADMRNSGDTSYAGVQRGGMFIKQFVREKTKWAHIDLANVSYDHGIVPYDPRKGASAWGVRLLVDTARLLSA